MPPLPVQPDIPWEDSNPNAGNCTSFRDQLTPIHDSNCTGCQYVKVLSGTCPGNTRNKRKSTYTRPFMVGRSYWYRQILLVKGLLVANDRQWWAISKPRFCSKIILLILSRTAYIIPALRVYTACMAPQHLFITYPNTLLEEQSEWNRALCRHRPMSAIVHTQTPDFNVARTES